MPQFEEGDRVRIDIPDTTDLDFDAYHGTTGTVKSVLQDEAGEHTGDDRDNYLFRIDVDDGQEIDLRWRDLRPLSTQSE